MVKKKVSLGDKKEAIIRGRRVVLVPFSEKHLHSGFYLSWLRDYETIKYLNLPAYLEKAVTFEELEAYVDSLRRSQNNLFFAVESLEEGSEGKFIGTCKIGPIDFYAKHVNLGILIGNKEFWGRGLATEIFALAIEYCFEELEMFKIIGGCMGPNVGMRKVFEKLGFKEEGVFRKQDFLEGEYHDHYHFGLFREEFESAREKRLRS